MKKLRLSYLQIIVFGFLALILLGAGLLCLPAATRDGVSTPFVDALFTATSATCVTGLAVFDTFTYWSTLGQLVILFLIQIGGLGFITIFTMFAIISKRRIGLQERMYLMQAAGSIELEGLLPLIRNILLGTFAIETSGAVLLAIPFVRDFGAIGLYKAVFTSISAFCNAGFDLMGTGTSIIGYEKDPLVMIPLMLLIVLGSIGFLVWQEILTNGIHLKRYSLHSKIVLSTTGILLGGGALLFLIFEWNGVLRGMNIGEAVQQSFFLAVTPRTAGFASVPYGSISGASWLLTIVLMVIGGAPGSTAGGVKITTFAVLVLDAFASARQSNQVTVFKRRLDEKVVKQANAIFITYAGIVFGGSMILCAVQDFPVRSILLEVVSAASTVGLSEGITASLAPVSKLLVTLMMYGGRIGCMTLALLVSEKRTPPPINRPTEKILVG